MDTGIYLIIHTDSGIPYVGKTAIGFQIRWATHVRALNANQNKHPKLQRAWNAFGKNAFEFCAHTIIQQGNLTDKEFNDLLFQEERKVWLLYPETLNSIEPSGFGSGSPDDEIRQKIRKSLKGTKQSSETCLKKSNSHKGLKHSAETKAKILMGIRKSITPERNQKIRESKLAYWANKKDRKMSEEQKEKIAKSMTKYYKNYFDKIK